MPRSWGLPQDFKNYRAPRPWADFLREHQLAFIAAAVALCLILDRYEIWK